MVITATAPTAQEPEKARDLRNLGFDTELQDNCLPKCLCKGKDHFDFISYQNSAFSGQLRTRDGHTVYNGLRTDYWP